MQPSLRTIRVEFYGIPRSRTGVAETSVDLTDDSATLAEILEELGDRFPPFAVECLCDHGLRDEYAANIHGERFVRQMDDVIRAGDTLLILSTDGGG